MQRKTETVTVVKPIAVKVRIGELTVEYAERLTFSHTGGTG